LLLVESEALELNWLKGWFPSLPSSKVSSLESQALNVSVALSRRWQLRASKNQLSSLEETLPQLRCTIRNAGGSMVLRKLASLEPHLEALLAVSLVHAETPT
jgi:hypothetical protein